MIVNVPHTEKWSVINMSSLDTTRASKMPLTQEEPRYEFQKHFSVTNNNDHSYLHKKFKKMATVHPPLEEKGHTSSHDNISSLNITAELKKGDIVQYETNESTTNIERLNISTVQINFKGNENHLNLVKQTNDKSVFRDDKIDKTEYMDTELQRNQQNGGNGRHVCPYCKLSCAKPSVLQKHIRAHTNERPFPCVPCGFAFKTKSNYYKHSRTRTHALRINNNGVINESEWAGDIENDLHSTSENNTDISCLEDVRPSSVSSCESSRDRVSPSFSSTSNLTRAQDNIKGKSIYKPKFHRPYKEEEQQKKVLPTNAEFLNEHISKIISDNEAIVDVLDVPLQKKYNKIKQIAETKHMETDEMFHENRNEQPLNLHKTTPLNLSKSIEGDNQNRKRNFSESFQSGDSTKVTFNASKPTNPERSIIKDLLLKTKAFSGPNENYDNTDVLFVCQLCNIPHRNAEIHRLYYCKGKRNGHLIKSSSLSPNDSKITKPEQIYARSHSVNVTLSETNCSTTFIKVPNGVSQVRKKPDDIFIKSNEIIVDTPLPSPGPLLGNTRLVEEPKAVRKTPETTKMAPEVIVLQQKSSPKRFEWKNTRMLIENAYSKPSKIRCLESMNSSRQTTASLQMYGGEIKILNTGSASRKLRGSLSGISPIKPGEESRPHNLHSGVRIIQNSSPPIEVRVCSRPETPNYKISITPQINPKLSLPTTSINFPFSPLGAITAYNPLTLPPLSPSFNSDEGINIFHGGKIIPHVPGIPGPNTQITASNYSNTSKIQNTLDLTRKGNGNTVIMEEGSRFFKKLDSTATPKLKHHSSSQIDNIETESVNSPNCSKPQPALLNLPLIKIRNADDKQESNDNLESYNIATTKLDITRKAFEEPISGDKEATTFNFENFISKSEIANNQNDEITDAQNSFPNNFERSEPLYFQKNKIIKPLKEEIKSKFLRPSTLPLKPGTFTPKKHHGITPNANTMPLISPETPRPAKAYGQLYLNGNAYTYLGLKCSTKVYYCTVNRPQPTYVPNQHSLSMYSNWQICSEVTPHPLGLTAGAAMFLYDSRHRPQDYSVAKIQTECVSTHSSQLKSEERQYQKSAMTLESKTAEAKCTINESLQKGKELAGGFESNEEYTYVRGRGRGRYVCSECGIRCKKPSMLKKHIRTHTDVRPYTCKHCAFSFKTKGNLTKHMKSKAHYKRCCELGINPSEGGECVDMEIGETNQGVGDTDEETESENDEGMEGETESSDTDSWKSRLPEREAAHCLLSLSRASPGIISSARPCTYPYAPTRADENIPINAENQLNEPMDLSKSEIKAPEIILSREHSILVSLASNTAKLPQQKSEWTNGEPMLNAYLTEKALQDTKIKQSQLITGVNKVKLDESKPPSSSLSLVQLNQINHNPTNKSIAETSVNLMVSQPVDFSKTSSSGIDTLADVAASSARIASNSNEIPKLEVVNTSMENAKLLASEYLKMARSKFSENIQSSERPEIVEDKPSTESKYRNDEDYEIRIDNAIKPQNENEGVASKVVIGAGGVAFKVTSKSSEYQNNAYLPGRLTDDGRAVCNVCNKTFSKQSQLRLHINIHYMERPFRCSACGVSFRTKGHLQKHERSSTHLNKVSMTSTFGAATTSNPRPFKCTDCVTSFRIHGHLAKHLRSKMHVMRLECSGKLPFGTFAEIERAGVSLTDIDTTDCANSLASLQLLAQKLHEKDPTKLETWDPNTMVPPLLPAGKESSDEEDNGVEAKVKQQSVKDISEVKLHKQINTEEKTY